MRQTLARLLFITLVVASCKEKAHHEPTSIELSATESLDDNSVTNEVAAGAPEEGAESGGTGTAMALDEGKMGKLEGQADISAGFDDQNLTRAQAIEAARTAGTLGSTGFGPGGGGTGYGTIGSGRYGAIGHGVGTAQGYGVGGGRGGMRGRAAVDDTSSEDFTDYGTNGWTAAATDHLSTFAADVDTASYTIMRRKLTEGTLPPTASVRVEELVNYFKYGYAAPATGQPFSVALDMAPSPLGGGKHVLRVGVSTKPLSIAERKQANLVFLVDVSGSMQPADRLPLAKRALRILVDSLKDGDTVSLVTYAGNTRVVLPPTGVEHRNKILSAIDDLSSGGGTAMGAGVELAYREAAKTLHGDVISRVIVLSDGDANIGGDLTHEQILAKIAGKVKEGVTLSTIGFGMGNYKDTLMEQLANKGNGNNFYIDGLSAAKRVFQEQLGSTLEVIAKDVKLQIDFDQTRVKRYRLVGYENRNVADDDFRNDKVDAGEIGAGHQVTAIYEVELAEGWAAKTEALATVHVRHKAPRGTTATEATFPIAASAIAPSFAQATADFRFAFAVAAFGDVMRGADAAKGWDLQAIKKLASDAAGQSDDRKELVTLIDRALTLRGRTARVP